MCVDEAHKTEMISCKYETIRYALNGLFATFVHYLFLKLNMQFFEFQSAALANGLASIVGISVSFVGSKFYVYRKYDGDISKQALQFVTLYACIAFIHISILFLWTDYLNLSYKIGFIIAMVFQVGISYFGNKLVVFK